jgi:hypothetical protein
MYGPQMTDFDDPGWRPVLRRLGPAVIFPWIRLSKGYRQKEKAAVARPLMVARTVFVGIFVAPFLFLFVLSSVVTGSGRWSSPGGWGWAAAGFGTVGLLAAAALRRQSLRDSDADALLRSWNSALFIGIGRACLPEFAALVLTITSHRLWVFVIGLAFTVVCLLLVAPSRGNIERRQSQLDARGTPLSLGQVLMTPLRRAFG